MPIQFERVERIAFNHDLSEWNHKEAAAEHRAEQIEQNTEALMQPNEKFYPWTFANFTEAIENASEAERKVFFAFTAEAVEHGLKDDHRNHMAMCAMRLMVEQYWNRCAVIKAKREIRGE